MNDSQDRTIRALNLHLIDSFSCNEVSGMPLLDSIEVRPDHFKAFNTCARNSDPDAAVHFFLDDYRFEAVWSDPERYVSMLMRYGCVLTPDFSVYLDMPEPMQRWNVYRGRAVGRIWQNAGLKVIPTLTWGEENTYSYAFEGIPYHSTVALSTVGLMNCKEGIELFIKGAETACKVTRPRLILAYGKECSFDTNGAEIIWYEHDMDARFKKIKESKKKELTALESSKPTESKGV